MNIVSRARLALSAPVAICAFLLMQPAQYQNAQAAAATPPALETLRVGMWTLWHDRELKLSPAMRGGMISLRTCAQCGILTFANSVVVRSSGDSVVVDGAGKTGNAHYIELAGGVTLTAHNETVTLHYPLTITSHAGALVMAVTLPVENYVERVVASESGPDDSLESLKALAVVVRSFALHETHGHGDYDVCDSTHCQLLHWGGNGNRQHAAHAATLSTAGETLWFRGQRALAYFNKDCGGRTAGPKEIWPRAQAVAYLPSLPDRYCVASAGREWASQLTRADLSAALAAHGFARSGWQRLTVTRRGESGRATVLSLDNADVAAEDVRLAVGESLGWNRLPSTWFEVRQQGDNFFFHGRGWGHGVGLCQKGAAAMAAQNSSAAEILAQYFPGARAADESTGREWQTFARSGIVLQSLDATDAAYLPDLERARAEASRRSGLNMPQAITVRTFASTPAFRSSTGAPGWVAAFTEGDWIGMQPLRILASRHLLDTTMRHEFLHALVEQQAGPSAQLWLREGLVEMWAKPDVKVESLPVIRIYALDASLTRAATESDSAAAHHAASSYAGRLLARYGRELVLDWLRSGVPADVVSALGQR